MKFAKTQTAERYEAVKQIYFDSWGRLRDDALQSNPNLTAEDAFDVVASLSEKLYLYPSHLKLTEDAFAQWAAAVLTQTVFMHGLRQQCESNVRKAIRKFLAGCGGLGVNYRTEFERGTEDEIASDTWLWALTHIDELRKPGPASLPSRMFDVATDQARAWKSKQIAWKSKHPDLGEIDLLYLDTETRDGEIAYELGWQSSGRQRGTGADQDSDAETLAA